MKRKKQRIAIAAAGIFLVAAAAFLILKPPADPLAAVPSELAEQVTLTRYDNGKGILVNYADEAFTWQGVTVEGRDFALVDLT